jgi:hypothetical protein
MQEAKRGLGASAVFFARNRFAVLDKATNTIQVGMGSALVHWCSVYVVQSSTPYLEAGAWLPASII